ncbi:hypothetical protein CMO83_02455 [Candidatus Woesearchaeota archaeon]|jgi:hypothetical protein|nr:hypothetical protein [Candidatus Woesearchaeota archaeon]MDP6648279.1 LAGLIDADG family homing endonuclease [Candidatus Woesearchaeota archaeon]|tara:strand:- start:33843 stop:34595 length:753 start_codon:yes stop_codon:yes gene_type:complete
MHKQKINHNLINPEIAEILGAFIGDGWIESNKGALYITGSPSEDKLYYDNHLSVLFSKYFESVEPKNFAYWGVYGISSYKKKVIRKAIDLGFQIGHKSSVAKIPDYIVNSKDMKIIKAVIRGIFDSDGSFWCERSRAKTSTEWKKTHNYHPEMCISSCSNILLEQIRILLNKLGVESQVRLKHIKGFKNNRNISDSYQLNIRKIAEIEKFFYIIKPSNPRHQTRYQVWKKLGYLDPYTKIEDRLKILVRI